MKNGTEKLSYTGKKVNGKEVCKYAHVTPDGRESKKQPKMVIYDG